MMTAPTTREGIHAGGSALVIVPARLRSTRLPRKMLLCDTGRFLFQHTAENAREASTVGRVVVATDSDEILRAAEASGIEALRTSGSHPTGTDRAREAHATLRSRGEGPWGVVLVVQGDEPELPPADLDRLVAAFASREVELATLWAPLRSAEEASDPNVVKLVADRSGDALYFSRAPVPGRAHGGGAPELAGMRRHVGVYAFRPDALERFVALPRGELEAAESLEQLRWLEAGLRIRTVEASASPPGIDTAEHYAAFVARHRDQPVSGIPIP